MIDDHASESKSRFVRQFDYVRKQDQDDLFLLYHLNSDIVPDGTSSITFDEKIGSDFVSKAKAKRTADIICWTGELTPRSELAPVDIIPMNRRSIQTRTSIERLICDRRSLRDTVKHEVPLDALSFVLENSMGITYEGHMVDIRGAKRKTQFRAAPSGGGLFPMECYLFPLTVKDVPFGLYHYSTETHSLERLRRSISDEELARAFLHDSNVLNAAAIFMYAARFQRTSLKYGERCYRFILLETGCIIQNMILSAEALGLRGVPLGGYVDGMLNEIIGCGVPEDAVVMCGAFGKSGPGELKSNV